jgi:D-alanine-D-alanine ligase
VAWKCQSLSSKIYNLLGCKGIVRIDFINHEGTLYFLELNGVPGMTQGSIIPRQIRAMGRTEAEIYNLIIGETAGW